MAWIALTYVGFALGSDLHLQAYGPTGAFHLRDVDLPIFGFILGAISGMIIGGLQWIVLRKWTSGARAWIIFNALGFGLVHGFNDAVPYRPLDLPVVLVIGGLLIGAAQAFALPKMISAVKAWVWVPVATVAWFIGKSVGLDLVLAVWGNPLAGLVVGHGAAGLIFGAITGPVLLWMSATSRWVSDNS